MTTITYGRPDPAAAILDQLLTNLRDALTATAAGLPARVEITHGTRPTLDTAPMGWVRPVQFFPSTDQFGSQDNRPTHRKQPFRWAFEIELGVIRCVPGVSVAANRGALPTADQITAATATIMEDARALRSVAQYLNPYDRDVMIRQWQPIGPQGGSAGGALVMSVPFSDCRPTVA